MFRKVSLEVAYPQATELLACLFQGSKIFAVSPAMSDASIVSNLSSFARNGKVGQPFPLRICQLSKLSKYTEGCSIFERHLINEISEILDKYRRNHYYSIKMIIKKSLF